VAENPSAFQIDEAGAYISVATQATLEAVRVLLVALDAKDFSTEATLDAFLTAFNAEDFASQTTLAALLAAFNSEDFSSETTLAALKAAFDAEDFASQTTLAALLAAFNGEDFSSETTLAALKASFDAEDFASETTLLSADGRLATIDAVLDSIKDTDGIKKITDPVGLGAGTEIVGKVYITDGVDDVTITEDLVDDNHRGPCRWEEAARRFR
jgi:hypothetical protein